MVALVCVSVGIASSVVLLNICIIAAWIKKYKSIMKKANKKMKRKEKEKAWWNSIIRER